MPKTICAIATPPVKAALGIIRVSGPCAVQICGKILTLSSGKSLEQTTPRTVVCATAHGADGKPIDYLTAVRYVAPASFTGEDSVELFCHGSPLVLRSIMESLIAAGARQALPGEFTKRAFINGKTDLLAAEGIMELISAQSQSAAKIALNHLAGRTGSNIAALRDEVIHLSAGVLAQIDFPDEDISEQPDLEKPILELLNKIEKIRSTYGVGKAFCEGIPTVILGRPNVGKSTLMNLLTGEETSIVTEVAGTTRDIVEKRITLGDFSLILADTAGLRDTKDIVESIGVERALKRMETSSLLLCVFDGSQPAKQEDMQVVEAAAGKPAIAVVNKADLPGAFDKSLLEKRGFSAVVTLSAKTGEGLDRLVKAVSDVLGVGDFDVENTDIITNIRHFESLSRAADALRRVLDAISEGAGAEIVSLELEETAAALGEVTGQSVSDEIIDRIFERFCLGK